MLTMEKLQVIPALHIHGGVYTVKNVKLGTWKTFKIRTQRNGEWKPQNTPEHVGVRIVSMLKGRNNDPLTGSYKGIGLLLQDQRGAGYFKAFGPWKGLEEEVQCEFFINMMEENVPHRDIELFRMTFCSRCALPLSTPESISTGLGPDCRKLVRL